eukprot:TRINITY_DN20198_c2_g1_i1.p1 TRINITY_DN20198_c2_g1~~TRINITY_DN20198_c2_g1_i1.p1  ORF type:complete len:208 (+),score=47.71 TRINITY_DN20198_c2_g1_i1:72-626(+)
MSFRNSNILIKKYREVILAEEAKKRIAATVVSGRSKGCTVRYSGCGRVEGITFDDNAALRDSIGELDYSLVSKSVKEAVLDAQQKMTSVKQAEWMKINPRIVTKHINRPDLLQPLPDQHFKYQSARKALDQYPHSLSSTEVQFGLSLNEARSKREKVRMSLEQLFWTSGRAIDKQTAAIAGRAP